MNIEELNTVRKQQGLSIDELAKRSKLPKSTIEKVLFGVVKHPRIDTMRAIEEALELNTAPLQWTEEDKALGVGNHPVKLTEKEWRILEAFNELERVKGEAFSEKMLEMIEAIPALPEKK